METRVRNFVIDKAVGLLQSFKTRLPPNTCVDIENGLLDVTRSPPSIDTLQHCPGCERSRSIPADLEGDDSRCTDSPANAFIQHGFNQQPQFTEGPARFVMANDGLKDCMAMLVTNTLVGKLRELHEDSHHLSGKQGPLNYARRQARDFETSINQIEASIEVAESQEKVEELREMVQQQESQLFNICQRRDELEKRTEELERNVTSSKAHIQWVLDTAMKEADLLEPHRPLTPVTMTDIESESRPLEKFHRNTHHGKGAKKTEYNAVQDVVDGTDFPKEDSAILAKTDDLPQELQLLRREAWESYNETLATMHKIQALFDSRQESYETDLAEYQQGFAVGIYKIPRSEFDRSKILYGHKVTRALINAEEAFEAAKEHAHAVGASGSDCQDTGDCYGCYEESWPENQLASYLASKDWGHIHDWLAGLLEPCELEEVEMEMEPPEVDEWYADEVDPADSISQVDFDEYRRDIDRWENVRLDRWEDMRSGPEVQVGFLARSIESLKRRHSITLCPSRICEWEANT